MSLPPMSVQSTESCTSNVARSVLHAMAGAVQRQDKTPCWHPFRSFEGTPVAEDYLCSILQKSGAVLNWTPRENIRVSL
mgnify:CR=1 FL=1|jgi:hypothetical protein